MSGYALDNSWDRAKRRLALLEHHLDPMTRRRFKALGLGEGARCLEVGAGGGSIAVWLSAQVGATGGDGETSANGAGGAAAWVERVRDEAAGPVAGLVTELAVAPLPEDRPEAIEDYVHGVMDALVDLGLTRQIADARGRLQRMDPVAEADPYAAAFAELVALEGRRRALRRRD